MLPSSFLPCAVPDGDSTFPQLASPARSKHQCGGSEEAVANLESSGGLGAAAPLGRRGTLLEA
eukprot:9629053-Alexandrium_andersonii.AAC.1